jgi:hypothetical protein
MLRRELKSSRVVEIIGVLIKSELNLVENFDEVVDDRARS